MRKIEILRAAHGRHARVTWSFIALALMLPACAERTNNSDTATPLAVTARGAEIVDVERDDTRRTVVAGVAQDGIARRLKLSRVVEHSATMMVASVEDDGGFFELSIGIDEHTGEVWVRERTAVDEMTIRVRRHDGRVDESYEINGDRLAFNRPDLPLVQLDKVIARYHAGELWQSDSPEMAEMNEKLSAFDAFYTPTTSNTLHNNAQGELLMDLLTDPGTAGALTGHDRIVHRKNTPAERVCWLAVTCVSLKARFLGGLPNPITAACIGTMAACVFTEVACWIAGCDCCF